MSRLKAQIRQTGMVVRPSALGPVKLAVRIPDRLIIDAGKARLHESVVVKLPVLITVRAIPVIGVIAPFIGEAHGNAIVGECLQLLDQSIFQLTPPFALQELDNLPAANRKLGPIAPATVDRIGQGNLVCVFRIPAVFRHSDLLDRRFTGEGWKRWSCLRGFCLAHDDLP